MADYGVELMMVIETISDDVALTIGSARGEWNGPGHLYYAPGVHAKYLIGHRGDPALLDELVSTAKDQARRRRRSLKKCRYCNDRTPPEHRFSPDTCYGCASEHLGVVY